MRAATSRPGLQLRRLRREALGLRSDSPIVPLFHVGVGVPDAARGASSADSLAAWYTAVVPRVALILGFLVVVLGLALMSSTDSGRHASLARGAESREVDPSERPLGSGESEGGHVRAPASTIEDPGLPQGSPASASGRAAARLEVRAVDLDGVPAPHVAVYAAPPRHVLNACGETDARGRCDVLWRQLAGPAELIVELRGRDGRSLTGLRRVRAVAGNAARVEVVLDPELLPAPDAPVDLQPAADAVAGREVRVAVRAPTWGNAREDATFLALVGADVDGSALDFLTFEEPGRGGHEPVVLRDDAGVVAFVSGHGRGHGIQVFEDVSVSDYHEVEIDPELAYVEGTVTDQQERPARGVRVALERRGGATIAAARSAADGTFRFELAPGEVRLRAGSLARGSAADVALGPGETFVWRPTVRREAELCARVDADALDLLLETSARVRDGAGEVLHVGVAAGFGDTLITAPAPPAPSFDVHLSQVGQPLVHRRFEGLVAGAEVPLTFLGTSTLRLTPRDERPTHSPASEVRLFEPGGERGARAEAFGERGAELEYTIGAGLWQLEALTAGSACSAPIAIDAAAGGAVEVGAVTFGPTGTLRLPRRADDAATLGATVWRDDAAYEAVALPRSLAGDADVTLELPTGRYRVVHDDGEERLLRIAGGDEATLAWRAAPRAPSPEGAASPR